MMRFTIYLIMYLKKIVNTVSRRGLPAFLIMSPQQNLCLYSDNIHVHTASNIFLTSSA